MDQTETPGMKKAPIILQPYRGIGKHYGVCFDTISSIIPSKPNDSYLSIYYSALNVIQLTNNEPPQQSKLNRRKF